MSALVALKSTARVNCASRKRLAVALALKVRPHGMRNTTSSILVECYLDVGVVSFGVFLVLSSDRPKYAMAAIAMAA